MPSAKKTPAFPTLRQVSAGGVLFRRSRSQLEFAIIQALPERRWQLPKGIVDEGETPDQTAVREVREEAGVNGEIVAPIDTIEYWYFSRQKEGRVRYHKFVHFFLMEYRSGDVADHDHEVAEARWADHEEAGSLLAFKSEREMLERAKEMIKKLSPK